MWPYIYSALRILPNSDNGIAIEAVVHGERLKFFSIKGAQTVVCPYPNKPSRILKNFKANIVGQTLICGKMLDKKRLR